MVFIRPALFVVYHVVLAVKGSLRSSCLVAPAALRLPLTAPRGMIFLLFLSGAFAPWGFVMFSLVCHSFISDIWVPSKLRARNCSAIQCLGLWCLARLVDARFHRWQVFPIGPQPRVCPPRGWSVALSLAHGTWCSRPVAFFIAVRGLLLVLRVLPGLRGCRRWPSGSVTPYG